MNELKRQGLGLVAISYDPPEILRAFSASRGITFPLIADAGSAIIKSYGRLNTTIAPGDRTYGVPFPGTLVVDANGIVRTRAFEEAYQERMTSANLLVQQGKSPFGPSTTTDTPHLTLVSAASDERVSPGSRVSLIFDITPRRGIHVYAPGKHTYQVVRITIDPQPWLRVRPITYPPSEIYHFEPLDERVEVYQKPFRLLQDVTILATPEAQKQLAGQTSLTLTGKLDYQACDDKVCYAPRSVPVKWTFALQPLDRKPAG